MPCGHPPIPKSPGKNWIERIPGGRIPEEIECVARALYWSPGRASGQKQKAYEMAVGIAEDWAAGRRKITPEKQAKYVAAIAKWQALRAASHTLTASKKAASLTAEQQERVVIELAHTMEQRQKLAKQGKALPDSERGGRFPIANVSDLQKAIRAIGRAGGPSGTEEDRRKVRRYVMRRARELGATKLIPDSWKSDGSVNLAAELGQVIDLSLFDPAKHPRKAKGPGGGQFSPASAPVDKKAAEHGQKVAPSGEAPKGPEKVKALQQALGVERSGKYDQRTRSTVTRFQSRYGLKVDGIAGRQTLTTLKHVYRNRKGKQAAKGAKAVVAA